MPRRMLVINAIVAAILLLPFRSAAQDAKIAWPPGLPSVTLQCSDASFLQIAQIIKSIFATGNFSKTIQLTSSESSVLATCISLYNHPAHIIEHAWVNDFLGAALFKIGERKRGTFAFELARRDLSQVDDYAMPSAIASVYETVATDLKTFTGKTIASPQIVAQASSDAVPPSATVAPVVVTNCDWQFLDPKSDDYTIVLGVSFENVSSQPLTAVKFAFTGQDALGGTVLTDSGIVTGTFSPNVVINPKTAKFNVYGAYINNRDDSGSSAWTIYNLYGTRVQSISCVPTEARYSDGTTWTASH